MNNLTDRIFKNPFSSVVGLVLVGAGLYVLNIELSENVKLVSATLLIGGGLVALGLKDKKGTDDVA